MIDNFSLFISNHLGRKVLKEALKSSEIEKTV